MLIYVRKMKRLPFTILTPSMIVESIFSYINLIYKPLILSKQQVIEQTMRAYESTVLFNTI